MWNRNVGKIKTKTNTALSLKISIKYIIHKKDIWYIYIIIIYQHQET